jgi:hypothetical protein
VAAAVEQVVRYREQVELHPACRPARALLVAPDFAPQARVLAEARDVECVHIDLEVLRGEAGAGPEAVLTAGCDVLRCRAAGSGRAVEPGARASTARARPDAGGGRAQRRAHGHVRRSADGTLADATWVAVAEERGARRVFTLDGDVRDYLRTVDDASTSCRTETVTARESRQRTRTSVPVMRSAPGAISTMIAAATSSGRAILPKGLIAPAQPRLGRDPPVSVTGGWTTLGGDAVHARARQPPSSW